MTDGLSFAKLRLVALCKNALDYQRERERGRKIEISLFRYFDDMPAECTAGDLETG